MTFLHRVAQHYHRRIEDAAWWGAFYGAACALLLFVSVMFLSMAYHTPAAPDLGHVRPVERVLVCGLEE